MADRNVRLREIKKQNILESTYRKYTNKNFFNFSGKHFSTRIFSSDFFQLLVIFEKKTQPEDNRMKCTSYYDNPSVEPGDNGIDTDIYVKGTKKEYMCRLCRSEFKDTVAIAKHDNTAIHKRKLAASIRGR